MADKMSSEVIGGKRMCGKTTELIRRAFRDQLYILCANKRIAEEIYNQSKKMDLDIPYPITPADLPLTSGYVNRVLVDEVEMVLSQLVGTRIVGMTTSYPLKELDSLVNGDKSTKKSIGSLKVDIDCSDALKGLKAVQREARKTTSELKALEVKAKEIGCKTKEAFSEGERLLVIELDDEESLPRVYYKGEEVNLKTLIDFHWESKTDKSGKLSFNVQYYELSEKGSPNKVGIGLEKERW